MNTKAFLESERMGFSVDYIPKEDTGSMADKFKWIDFYTEFASKLLSYKGNRSELISKLQNVYASKEMKLPKLEKTEVPVDIDPFTVFGLFNKGITNENRISILDGIKAEFGVEADVPDSFDSIPVLNNMKATFYGFEGDRKENDIDNLWAVLEKALAFADSDTPDTRDAFKAAYDAVLGQLCVRWNITMGLYWIRPYCFMSLDSRNRWFMGDETKITEAVAYKVSALKKVPSAEDYLSIRDASLAAVQSGKYPYSSFPELSYSAWKESQDAKQEFIDDDSPLLSEFVERIIREFPVEKTKAFAENEFGKFIRTTVPKNIFKTGIVNQTEYTITGSVGQGNWVTIPWVAIFDKKVTKSAQKGEYIVYLLSLDQKTLYLTFNQGCTDLTNQYGKKKALELLQEKVEKARQQIDSRGFSTEAIDLAAPGEDKAKMYEAGCIFSRAYAIDDLPSEEDLRADLKNMVDIYKDYTSMFLGAENAQSTPVKKAWLVTYNVKNWNWENFEQHCADSLMGLTYEDEWACASKQPKIGEDVYLMKTGDKPRGIMAHGVVSKEAFEAPHYDPDKAAQGLTVNKIKIIFDRIIDFNKHPILERDALMSAMPDQEWSPMASGVGIKDYYVNQLRKMWNKLIGIEEPEDEDGDEEMSDREFGLNTILYGPPGTGKTYNTVNYAVAICDGLSLQEVEAMGYESAKARYEELKDPAVGRIAFTTFHQSYGYEEFIEGIRPIMQDDDSESENLGYKIEPGIFRSFCERAGSKKYSGTTSKIKENPVVWKISLEGAGDTPTKRDCFANNRIRIGWSNIDRHITDETECKSAKEKTILTDFEYSMEIGDLVAVLHTQNSIDAVGVVTGDYEWLEDGGSYPRCRKVEWLAKGFEADIREINNGKVLTSSTVYRLDVDPNEIIKIAKAQNASLGLQVEEKKEKYVFIIDEINRGNISKIFGELITLIEDTKRKGRNEEAHAILPYSGKPFSVPDNVYILGTMNTADRSIALMDTALRRRFDFIEKMPEESLLNDVVVSKGDISVNIGEMLRTINERIEFLFDREHTIGHAFFMKLTKEGTPSLTTLAEIFKRSVVPLLQEYFYEDYEKIQLVLGDNGKDSDAIKFIKSEPMAPSAIFRGHTKLEKSVKYSINDQAFEYIESYAGILNTPTNTAEDADEEEENE